MSGQFHELVDGDGARARMEEAEEDELVMRFGSPRETGSVSTVGSGSTGNALAQSLLPTPLLERMARDEMYEGDDDAGRSPSWWRKFGLAGRRDTDTANGATGAAGGADAAPMRDGEPRWGRARRCVLCVLPITLVSLVCTYAVVALAVVPPVAQAIMNQSTLTVQRMHMMGPTVDTITLNATVELHDIGEISSTLLSCPVQVLHEGVVLAEMTLPELDMVGGEVLRFTMESEMLVKNVSAFTRATAKILQGEGGIWFISGSCDVEVNLLGLTRRFGLSLYKEFKVPATLLEDVRGYNTDVLGGATETSFNISSTTSFFSSSILEMYHLGLFVFDLEVLVDEAGHLLEDYSDLTRGRRVRIGKVVMEDFDLRQGVNALEVTGAVVKTAENVAVLSQFVTKFMNGLDQKALIKGPVQSASPFLDDVVTQALTFEGMKDPPIDLSIIDEGTLKGFSVHLPAEHKTVHYRGTKVVAHNPLSTAIAQHNITTQVRFSEPLGFKLDNPLLGRWTCPRSTAMAELFAAPGMYKGDAGRPPVVDMPANARVSFFLPGRPLPGQITQPPCKLKGLNIPVAGDYDCCMVAVQSAAACRAQGRGLTSFDVDTQTDFVLQLGNFTLPLRNSQRRVPTVFDSKLTTGFVMDAELKCSEFEFI